MEFSVLQKNVTSHISSLFKLQQSDKFLYHDLKHVNRTIEAVKMLTAQSKLNELGTFIVETAVSFYSTGFLLEMENGLFTAVLLAEDLLKEHNVQQDIRHEICELILAMDKKYKRGFLEELTYDAISSDYGDPAFPVRHKLLVMEKETLGGVLVNEKESIIETLSQMKRHRYFTVQGLDAWDRVKTLNITLLEHQLSQFDK
ncbi:hypothetical protein [Mucilaginibacter celer]|uniref:Uncharacterized protein n=1 Tax=Mucilaginibacter celer TaxID=2305508 RepID=A0A494VSK6_9SPHI|nr:hypothetical protein [Mucilaginibacter celer]AYL94345.1 hypothetical protein HYN43_003105 [Mucilaginibacter celer]